MGKEVAEIKKEKNYRTIFLLTLDNINAALCVWVREEGEIKGRGNKKRLRILVGDLND